MKMISVVKLLLNTYKPNDELMIDWIDKFQAGVDTEEQWELAVGLMEEVSEGMIDMYYVQAVVEQAINDLEEEKENE